ncbi:MAG: hypothetical protein RL186_1868 [Pseudomonadota bacterium]
MRRGDTAPKGPWIFGLLGLLPFYGALIGQRVAQAPYDGVCVTLFFAYSAIILSFLGGTRWGFEIGTRPDWPGSFTLLFSVLPSLIGLVAALSQYTAPVLGLGLLALGFAGMWLWDYATSGGGTKRWPKWYRPLRSALSSGAILAIAVQFWLLRG